MTANTSPSQVFRGAFRALRCEPAVVFIYWSVTLLGSAAYLAMEQVSGQGDAAEGPSSAQAAARFLFDILYPACWALAASVTFSRLGRELDKPLWKLPGDREAVRRFFLPWFILFLIVILSHRVLDFAVARTESLEAAFFGLLLVFLLGAWVIPIGACIMFLGYPGRAGLAETLTPLGRFFSTTILFVGFGFFVSWASLFLFLELHSRFLPLILCVDLIQGYCDCVIFAGIWEICRMHRNYPAEPDLRF